MEVKIAVIKEWFEGFDPSNEMEERFKSQVKKALEKVTQDFKVGRAIPMQLDTTKTWEENIKAHEAAVGGRIMNADEYQLIWAQLAAEGHDVIACYYVREEPTAPQPKDFWMNLDRSAPVSWIPLED